MTIQMINVLSDKLTHYTGLGFKAEMNQVKPYVKSWYGFTIIHMMLHGFVQIGYLTSCVYVFELLGPSKRHLAIMTSIMFSLGLRV